MAPDSALVPLVREVLILREGSADFCVSPEPKQGEEAPAGPVVVDLKAGSAPVPAGPAEASGALLHGSTALLPARVDPDDPAQKASERRSARLSGESPAGIGRRGDRTSDRRARLTGAAHQQP